MGRQTQFHMLANDCRDFLNFVQERDPVFVIKASSESPLAEPIGRAWEHKDGAYLWNQTILAAAPIKEVPQKVGGIRYFVDSYAPVIEFSYRGANPVLWNGRPGLLQGRVWANFENPSKEFESWYNAIIRWIRQHFHRNPVPLGGFVGPEAYDWYKSGGLLLPWFNPPITANWLSWVGAQDQDRALFEKQ